ncbi:MAG: potassium-transporting ATPase subunit KdpC [Candidatus Acidiferrales bacterium]
MFKELGRGLRLTIAFTILTGLLYPAAMTGISEALFPRQANGSLIRVDGKIVGSSLIGQSFSKPQYFHPRPSANGYDAAQSVGSNYGPTNQRLIGRVKASIAQFRKENPTFTGRIPADIVTASASGLDPDISPAAAADQAARVANTRGVSIGQVKKLISQYTKGSDLGFLGNSRVNVLLLNLALDQKFPSSKSQTASFAAGQIRGIPR